MSQSKTPEQAQLSARALLGTPSMQNNENPIFDFTDCDEIDIKNLQSEQQNIDSVLNYLL